MFALGIWKGKHCDKNKYIKGTCKGLKKPQGRAFPHKTLSTPLPAPNPGYEQLHDFVGLDLLNI